jgi:hypothetical protein
VFVPTTTVSDGGVGEVKGVVKVDPPMTTVVFVGGEGVGEVKGTVKVDPPMTIVVFVADETDAELLDRVEVAVALDPAWKVNVIPSLVMTADEPIRLGRARV